MEANTTGGQGFSKETSEGGQTASLADSLFAAAFTAEMDSLYSQAIVISDTLISQAPSTLSARAALERLYAVKLKTGENINTIYAYYNDLSSHPDEGLATVARRIAIRSLTHSGDYQGAISQHNEWAQTTPYFSDSVYSEIDVLSNQLLESGGRLTKTGNEKKVIVVAQPKAHRSKFKEYQKQSDRLLNLLYTKPVMRDGQQAPKRFALFQNYPNPFNPTTTIQYQLPSDSKVRIEIYNILGQRVRTLINKEQKAGVYKIPWDGRNAYGSKVASGLYIYRIKAETGGKTFVQAKKMLLVK